MLLNRLIGRILLLLFYVVVVRLSSIITMVVSDMRSTQHHPKVSSLAATKDVVDSEHTRKIISEDLAWSLMLVPLLKDLALNYIIKNFAREYFMFFVKISLYFMSSNSHEIFSTQISNQWADSIWCALAHRLI